MNMEPMKFKVGDWVLYKREKVLIEDVDVRNRCYYICQSDRVVYPVFEDSVEAYVTPTNSKMSFFIRNKRKKYFRIVKESPNISRIDQRHSLFFGLIKYWDKGASDLCPHIRFKQGVEALHHIKEKYPNSHVTLRYLHSEGF